METKSLLIILGIVAVVAIGVALWVRSNTPKETTLPQETLPTLAVEDTLEGKGVEAKIGDTVKMNYRGRLEDGTQFDSSYDRGEPFQFTIGQGSVIQGWEQGVPGMKVGGKRKLVIPPHLAYGAAGKGSIPPNATLTFEVELVEIIK